MKIRDVKKILRFGKIIIPVAIKSRFRPIPLWTHLYITRKCNLNCKYCFIKDNTKTDLDEEQLKKIIDHLYYLGCRFISFFGGEPTIKNFFINLVRYANQKGIITHVSTNGILLTPAYIDELGKAGIDVINLSVDSIFEFDESKKDYTKSKAVLDNLIEARKKYNFDINVNLVLTNKNINSVVETIGLIHAFKISISIGYILRNTYNDKPQDEDLFFKTEANKAALYKVVDEIKMLKKRGYDIIEPLQYFDDIKKFAAGNLSDWYCCAGEYYFSVDSNGKFQICAGLPEEDISIFDVDKDYYKKFAKITKDKLSRCKKLCLSNCLYDTSYFIKHPLSFLKRI